MSGGWCWREVAGVVGSLYVHIPFCARKCSYCDFASWATNGTDERMGDYVRALRWQLDELAGCGLLADCRTGYVGGGTPSMLGASRLAGLLRAMRRAAPGMRELTCEGNPDSLTAKVIAAAAAAGATRLSIGVQSLDDAELEALGRLHDARQAVGCVRAAVASGLDVSVDLMCAIPDQTNESWASTLAAACDLGVGHISVYPLQLEPGTPLGDRYKDDDPPWNDEGVQADRMEQASGVLCDVGLSRYEVASYALPGMRCLHNMAYWTGVPYVGVGHGAASMLDRGAYHKLRRVATQLPALPGWVQRVRLRVESPWEGIASVPPMNGLDFSGEMLSEEQAMAEDLMLGMRLSRGMGERLMEAAKETFGDEFARTVEGLERRGLVALTDGEMRPTQRGWLLGNEVFGALWSLAPSSVASL